MRASCMALDSNVNCTDGAGCSGHIEAKLCSSLAAMLRPKTDANAPKTKPSNYGSSISSFIAND
jgi:hypothetical protein